MTNANEDENLQSRFLDIIKILYQNGYFRSENFDAFNGYIEKDIFSEKLGKIGDIINIIIYSFESNSDIEKKAYKLLIFIIKKYKYFNERNQIFIFTNPFSHGRSKNIPLTIKDELEKDIYKMLDKVPKDKDPYLLNEILNKIHERWS